MSFFKEVGKPILKFMWKFKRQQIDQAILNKKSHVEGITIPDCTLYYRAIITNNMGLMSKQTHRTME
jgi:hypothetical protein